MLAKRIIPCLDVKDGRVVKGVNFVNLRDAGDPVELAALYDREGADELVFLDISASVEGRETMEEVVRQTAGEIAIPFTVGGGISKVEDMKRILRAGADKIAVNTAAVLNPQLIADGARRFGSQCIVVAIDAKYNEAWGEWEVYTHGGRKPSGIKALEWVKQAESLGAGEILLTSMDADGTKDGFDLKLTAAVSESVRIPVIASGGAGKESHFYDVFTTGKADAGLAATIFHYKEIAVPALKQHLREQGVESVTKVSDEIKEQLSLEQVVEHICWVTGWFLPLCRMWILWGSLNDGLYESRIPEVVAGIRWTWVWSRSRQELWHKGATSGDVQTITSLKYDCDGDTLLVEVKPNGPACHTGAVTCFHNEIIGLKKSADKASDEAGAASASASSGSESRFEVLAELESVIAERERERPEGAYTTYLFDKGVDKILKKIGEEASEQSSPPKIKIMTSFVWKSVT